MKTLELVQSYLKNRPELTQKDALQYFRSHEHHGNEEVPQAISNFFANLANHHEIKKEELTNFSQYLKTLPQEKQDIFIHLAFNISLTIYQSYENEINKLVEQIEEAIKMGKPIPQLEPKEYIGLINVYRLFTNVVQASNDGAYILGYPGIYQPQRATIDTNIPFAINTLVLVGLLPKSPDYYGVNLTTPLYPFSLTITSQEKVPLRKGVKNSDDYYPFKNIKKIGKGESGDHTFLATNGKKLLFVRGVNSYNPAAIMSSKIATMISSQHFSSERLLNNRLAASKSLDTYAFSVVDRKISDARKKYIMEDHKIFPGTGIIDEVNNFIYETDPNPENFGLSSENVLESHIVKIDFDRCFISGTLTKEDYENNILTRFPYGIYHGNKFVKPQTDPDYISEKLYARLKLSLLTESIFAALADKAFIIEKEEDTENRNTCIKQCVHRTKLALELFAEHPYASTFLTQNPTILNQCQEEINRYINEHFDEELKPNLKKSISERALSVQLTIAKINTPKSQTLKAGKPVLTTPIPANIFSRNKFQLLLLGLSTSLSFALGITLLVSGAFFWAGIVIIAATLSGSLAFGGKIAYDEYHLDATQPSTQTVESSNAPSDPRISQLTQALVKSRKEINQTMRQFEELLENSNVRTDFVPPVSEYNVCKV